MPEVADDTPVPLPLWVATKLLAMAGRVVPEGDEQDAYEVAQWAVEQITNGDTP